MYLPMKKREDKLLGKYHRLGDPVKWKCISNTLAGRFRANNKKISGGERLPVDCQKKKRKDK